MRRWRLFAAAAAAAALVGAVGAAWLAAHGRLEAEALRAALAPFCHQQADRCFELAGRPWAMCVRCTGWWAGVLAAAVGGFAVRRGTLFALLAATLALALAELITALPALRFAGGIALGAAVAGCVSITLNDRIPAAERWLSGRKQRFAKPS